MKLRGGWVLIMKKPNRLLELLTKHLWTKSIRCCKCISLIGVPSCQASRQTFFQGQTKSGAVAPSFLLGKSITLRYNDKSLYTARKEGIWASQLRSQKVILHIWLRLSNKINLTLKWHGILAYA